MPVTPYPEDETKQLLQVLGKPELQSEFLGTSCLLESARFP